MFLEPVPQRRDDLPLRQRILATATYLFFWLLATAIGLWLMFELRAVMVDIMILANLNPWAVRGFDRLAIFLLGLTWFVGMLWSEHYIRTGIRQKQLWPNIRRVAIIEVVLVAIVSVTRFLVNL